MIEEARLRHALPALLRPIPGPAPAWRTPLLSFSVWCSFMLHSARSPTGRAGLPARWGGLPPPPPLAKTGVDPGRTLAVSVRHPGVGGQQRRADRSRETLERGTVAKKQWAVCLQFICHRELLKKLLTRSPKFGVLDNVSGAQLAVCTRNIGGFHYSSMFPAKTMAGLSSAGTTAGHKSCNTESTAADRVTARHREEAVAPAPAPRRRTAAPPPAPRPGERGRRGAAWPRPRTASRCRPPRRCSTP